MTGFRCGQIPEILGLQGSELFERLKQVIDLLSVLGPSNHESQIRSRVQGRTNFANFIHGRQWQRMKVTAGPTLLLSATCERAVTELPEWHTQDEGQSPRILQEVAPETS